jgi:phage terminase large subunit-like protein
LQWRYPLGVAAAELARREAERQKSTDEWTWSWRRIGRPEQHPAHDDWLIWLILAGRGWGKTRTGVEFVRAEVEAGRATRIAIVAETAADARDVIAEGPSGFLSVGPPEKRPRYESSKRRLTWPNGAIATLYNATEPDQLRGPQHDLAWCDELAKWAYSKPGSDAKSPGQETWDMLQFGLRIGSARCVVKRRRSRIPAPSAIMTLAS